MAASLAIVWWVAPPGPQPLAHLLTAGWKLPFLITFVYGSLIFLYGSAKDRLERRNVELQRMVQAGAARLEIQEQELQRAREIQQSLLPMEIPQLAGFEVASAWQPARTVGGDYFDVATRSKSISSPTIPASHCFIAISNCTWISALWRCCDMSVKEFIKPTRTWIRGSFWCDGVHPGVIRPV